ncbi:hypothetical protein SAMN05444365_101626 [Micromonospora pattaloongensis]|uniref:Uncharacterized protein n=1 Tax=Micromonospora pattaloongensis TaxID=405436 RepID=A0A1H3H269_9ACTN|nr:hypothetical protein [Micromonospora pattaloongensis]SDY08874.1 hypothetical protein SAMN05444365_101626 [Micromonospora pattaloongensis]
MANDKEPPDDLHTATRAHLVGTPSTEAAGGRLDYAGTVEPDDLDEVGFDESIELVDAPVRQVPESVSRAEKRHNQPRH